MSAPVRALPWTSPLLWASATISLLLLAVGVRALIAPGQAAAGYGFPATSADAHVFVQAFGARNIGLSLFAIAAILLDHRSSLAVLFLCAAGIAIIDAGILGQHLGWGAAIIRPLAIAAVVAVLGWLLWR